MLTWLITVLTHAWYKSIIYLNNTGKRVKAVNDELKQYLFYRNVFFAQQVIKKH